MVNRADLARVKASERFTAFCGKGRGGHVSNWQSGVPSNLHAKLG
jgi:hypothetical protein